VIVRGRKLLNEIDICTHYITAIEYGDTSGLNDEEIKQVYDFLKEYPNCTFKYSEDSYFAMDYISGFMATCLEVKVYEYTGKSKRTN